MPIISPKIPSGLEELMRGLAKSVIKENPDNIYEFAAEYFENLLRERDGTVDQSYKKFATYKVYKKSKLERKKKERDNLNINQNEDNTNQHLINFSSDDHDEKSIGKKILSDTTSMFSPILQEEIPFVSSESEMNATVIQNDIVDGDGVLNIKKDTEDKNDIKTASLDNEKNSAALKIQSTYRGHKVRRDIKEQKILSYEDVEKSDETEKITIVEKDDLDENTNNKSKDQKINSNENKGLNVQSDDIAFEKCTNDNIELKENEKDCNLVLDPEITDANDIKLQDSFKEEKIENAFENILNDNDIGLLELNQENSKVHASLDENIEQETETFSKETLEGNESNKENEVELGRLENSNDIPKKIEKLLTSELSIENSKNNDNSIILNDTKEVLDQKLTGSLIEEDSNNIEIIKASAADEITENNVDIKGENELQINDEKNNFYRPLNDSKENIELIKEKSVEEAICKQKIFSYLEPSQDDQSDGEKKSKISTEIKYEKLQESFSQELEDSLENLESIEKSELLNQRISDTEQEKNISEKSVLIESQNEEQPRNRLENILQESISPYDLIDEVVNETATRKVNELFLNEKFSENTNDDINKILNPELISLKRHDEENNYNDENNKTMDEVLKPEKEESEIPENFLTQQNEFFNDNKRNEGFKEPIATNELDASLLNDPELQDAAVKIQAAFRGHQVRKDKDILTSHELSNEQHAETFDDLPLDDPELQDAAVKIQAAFRGHQVRKDKDTLTSHELSNEQHAETFDDLPLDDPELQDAAVKIQAAFRGHQVRKDKDILTSHELSNEQHAETFDDLPLDDPELQDAAVKIQAAFRGHQVRKDKDTLTSHELSNEQHAETFDDLPLDDPELQDAAVKIQAAFRGHQVRKDKDILTSHELSNEQHAETFDDLPLDDPELQDAAVKIQAAFRGHQVRKDKDILTSHELSNEQHAETFDDLPLDDPELQDAAVKIQAAFRGHQVRKDKETLKYLSTEQSDGINDIQFELHNLEFDDETDNENICRVRNDNFTPEINDINEVAHTVIDDVMEEAAVKIQAGFRGHEVRKDNLIKFNSEKLNDEDDELKIQNTIVIEQYSEGNDETNDNDEIEQQDTSADIDEIQESETNEQGNNDVEESIETAQNESEDKTNAQEDGNDDDDPNDEAEQTDEGENSGQQQQQQNEDNDVANMVLDDEMEQAALKIQSTFRSNKNRTETKSQDCKVSNEENNEKESSVEEELANMLLDPEIADATLKIQSVFRGQKARKEAKDKNSDDKEEKPEEEEKEEDEPSTEQPLESSSSDKTAKQLQDEEDIANLVMDDEMEKTALKIQSAFRGKIKRKPKDGEDAISESSNEGDNDEENVVDENFKKSEEQPPNFYEYFAMSNEYSNEEIDYDNYVATRATYSDETRFECSAFDQTIYPDEDDIHLMQGGGIFVEESREESTFLEHSSSSGGDDHDDSNKFHKNQNSSKSFEIKEDEEVECKINQKDLEIKAIESFDFQSKKDSAEAMYYSLKKNEIEAQKRFENDMLQQEDAHDNSFKEEGINKPHEQDEDDDDVVVLKTQELTKNSKTLKYRMSMDDSILSQDYSRQKLKSTEMFEKMNEISRSEEEEEKNFHSNIVIHDEDEDQFDDFYPGNIRSKIMASSVSIADSDYFDPTNNKSIIDDDTIKTALETIHSTDSESTIGSAATKIQVNDKNLTARRNNTFQYSSIGNAAIDKSLDDFIQSQELRIDRFDEEPEGYISPPPKKQESCDDFTDDTCTESDRKIAGVIEIKLEQKHFLTVDERRRTLHREDAIQRNSTRSVEEESSKSSSNASCEKNNDKTNLSNDVVISTIQSHNSIIDAEIEIPVPVLEKQKHALSVKNVKFRRQKTMPVQIESNVIRVLPKHLRKRIKSAESEKRKKYTK